MKTCQYCRYFNDPYCMNHYEFEKTPLDFTDFFESGILAEAIEEGFSNFDFAQLSDGLNQLLTKPKYLKLYEVFVEELEEAKRQWINDIGNLVERALNNYEFDESGIVKIKDPMNFYCNCFM